MELAPWRIRWFYRIMRPLFALVMLSLGRASITGQKNIPARGSVLLLSNHVTWLDPVWISMFARRPVRFLASAIWFTHPVLGPFLRYVGAIPKIKFAKDPQAVQTLVDFGQQGDAVALFPEGERNWNGRTRPVLPGIGRLIKRLGCPVQFVRIQGGHQMWPRWSEKPRSAPLYFEFDVPMTFGPELSIEEIETVVNQKLFVEPDACPNPSWVWGKRLADGLPNALWACPVCLTLEGLKVCDEAANVRCRSCGATWRVSGASHLEPLSPGASAISIAAATAKIEAHFGVLPRENPQAAPSSEVVLQGGRCSLKTVKAPKTVLKTGRLRLTSQALQLQDDGGSIVWEQPLATLNALSIEAARLMTLRTPEGFFELDPEGESRVKWDFFVRPYWRRARQATQSTPAS